MLIAAKNNAYIQKIKTQLDMKDLGEVKKILDLEITRDRGSCRLCLFQENYVKVLEWLNITEVRSVTTLLAGHFKLSSKQFPQ